MHVCKYNFAVNTGLARLSLNKMMIVMKNTPLHKGVER